MAEQTGTVSRWHWRHRWTRWEVVNGTTVPIGIIYGDQRGKEIPTQFQVRECQHCGLRQVKEFLDG